MYGIIAGQSYVQDIREAIDHEDILFEAIGLFDTDTFLQICQAVTNANVHTLFIDADCANDNIIIKGIRQILLFRNPRIVIIAPGRKPGDRAIAAMVGRLRVSDIVAPPIDDHEDEEDRTSIAPFIRQALQKNPTYADVARWDVEAELEIEGGEKKQGRGRIHQKIKERVEIREVERIVEKYKVLPSKTIVVGSLYPGAGSTFATVSLSRLLNFLGIPSAVVESPINAPELYHLLYGDKQAPVAGIPEAKNSYLSDQIMSQGRVTKRDMEWNDGLTTWYPSNPRSAHGENWTYEHTYKLLSAIKTPIVFYDISHHWQNPSVQEICMDADEILFVCDIYPSKFSLPITEKNTEMVGAFKKAGKSVHLIGNRDIDTQSKDRVEWLRGMPLSPVGLIPDIPTKAVVEAQWVGRLVQDIPEVTNQLLASCYALLVQLVPPSFPLQPLQEKKGGLLARLFK